MLLNANVLQPPKKETIIINKPEIYFDAKEGVKDESIQCRFSMRLDKSIEQDEAV